MSRLSGLILSLLSATAVAADYESIAQHAFEQLETDISEGWSYTETSIGSDGSYVAQHEADRKSGEPWRLIEVDGHVPTDKEASEFAKRKQAGDNEGVDDSNDSDKLFQPGSVRLLEEGPNYWLMSFSPVAESEDDQKFVDAVAGELRIAKQGRYVEYIDLSSRMPFKPASGVKIKQFHSRMSFGPAYDEGPIVPQNVESSVQGKAMFVVKIDERNSVTYSHYERIR